jgi:CRISPR-associated protein Csx17
MTTTLQPIPLTGCRHDVLGHALKAIGVLRAISTCAAPEDCDPDAEGWWNSDSAAFMIRSARYPDAASLLKFFAEKYRPTPIIAAWNKSGGVTDKITVVISGESDDLQKFAQENAAVLKELGLTAAAAKKQPLSWSPDASALAKIRGLLPADSSLELRLKVSIETDATKLKAFKAKHEERLDALGLPKAKKVPASGKLEFAVRWQDVDDVQNLLKAESLPPANTRKESAKKDGVLPNAAKLLSGDQGFRKCLELARQYVDSLQGTGDEDTAGEDVFLRYRDQLPDAVAESFDALCALHISQQNDNPLFVRRGRPGDKVNADIFLNFWDYFATFRKNPSPLTEASLFGGRVVVSGIPAGDRKGKGTPFFPDAIKSYNQGTDWVTEDFPFCPLDYLLAVEGALAMRGATSKTLSARSRSRAAFPFVFEGTETMTDEQGKSLRVASSFWLPIWTQPTTFGELQSFILDCQARLPGRDCRFSSDFARAIRSQGVDAGFFAFHEFQFRLKGANVPWTTAGRFVPCSGSAMAGVLNELLAPLDASGFLDQFEFNRERKSDLHPLRAPVLDTIETAAAEPSASKIVEVLSSLATLNSHLARSKSLREKVGGGRITFVPPLRCEDWSAALQDLENDPEFEIARALASIRGHEKQPDGTYSEVEPFLGSLVPLRRKQNGWYLPDPPSSQAVWAGIDLARDLASVLARRVLDSAKDVRPAIVGRCSARLRTILAFLRGEPDDRRIARLVEALSLIDWRFQARRTDKTNGQASDAEHLDPVPVAYAAARSLLEMACHMQRAENGEVDAESGPRAKVQRAVALLSRQEPRMAAAATEYALRRLAIVGVPNPYSEESRREKPKLAGRDVVQVAESLIIDVDSARRLAAAALIPLDWRDRWTLFRSITLPQTIK